MLKNSRGNYSNAFWVSKTTLRKGLDKINDIKE